VIFAQNGALHASSLRRYVYPRARGTVATDMDICPTSGAIARGWASGYVDATDTCGALDNGALVVAVRAGHGTTGLVPTTAGAADEGAVQGWISCSPALHGLGGSSWGNSLARPIAISSVRWNPNGKGASGWLACSSSAGIVHVSRVPSSVRHTSSGEYATYMAAVLRRKKHAQPRVSASKKARVLKRKRKDSSSGEEEDDDEDGSDSQSDMRMSPNDRSPGSGSDSLPE